MIFYFGNDDLGVRFTRLIAALFMTMAIANVALGQAPADAEEFGEDEARRYMVEMIIFEYAESVAPGNEIFLPDELPMDERRTRTEPRVFGDPGTELSNDDPVAIDDAEIDDEDPLAFLREQDAQQPETLEEIPNHIIQTQLEVLDPTEHAMKDIYEKLVSLDAYRPIMRAAWTQATYEEAQTLPIRLRRIGNAPLRLDGTVKLYLSRYLHFVVDLTIEARAERQSRYGRQSYDRSRSYGDRRSSYDYGFGYEQRPLPIKYRISEDRIFRNGELRYYDHPKFGVLARVTRVEEEELETDEMILLPANR